MTGDLGYETKKDGEERWPGEGSKAPLPDQIWWRQVGKSLRLLGEVERHLSCAESFVFSAPQGFPYEDTFRQRLREVTSGIDPERRLRLIPDKERSPGRYCLEELCPKDWAGRWWPSTPPAAYLCQNEALPFHKLFIWVTGIDEPQRLEAWQSFVEEYEGAAREASLPWQAVFILESSLPPAGEEEGQRKAPEPRSAGGGSLPPREPSSPRQEEPGQIEEKEPSPSREKGSYAKKGSRKKEQRKKRGQALAPKWRASSKEEDAQGAGEGQEEREGQSPFPEGEKKPFLLPCLPYRINESDCRVFCMEVLSGEEAQGYLVELAIQVGGNNPQLCHCLLKNPGDLFREPMETCRSVLSLGEEQLYSLIWRAQIRQLFPLLEECRMAILTEHKKALSSYLPVKNEYGSSITDPMDLEFKDIQDLVARHPQSFPGPLKNTVNFLRHARNLLAHSRLLTREQVERLLGLSALAEHSREGA